MHRGDIVTQDYVQVHVSGTLTCIDENGARALTTGEFHAVMDRLAEHLDDESEVTDPGTWGQATTGDVEIHFVLADSAAGAELNRRVGAILNRMSESVDLLWHATPNAAAPRAPGTILAQKRQICELVAT